jgi:TetR/AcrR family transcriptional repressor of nem operon
MTAKVSARDKLLETAFRLIRRKGYASTSVDELCDDAGVSKGSFFHYFPSKEALAVAAAHQWTERNVGFFGEARYHRLSDPLERILGYIEFRRSLLRGEVPEFTCLVGTMVQEAFSSNPEIREACRKSIFSHAQGLEEDLRAAIKAHPPARPVDAKSLALHTQAVIQGAFILAKASGDAKVADQSLVHLKNYVSLLFNQKK